MYHYHNHHTEFVVNKLMENNLYKGHSLYMDNYYTSVDLAHTLLEKKLIAQEHFEAIEKKSLIQENLLVSTQNMAYV